MSVELLDSIKEQAQSLSPQEKAQLADYLLQNTGNGNDLGLAGESGNEEETRRWRMEWLKTNREEYAGKYVALYDKKLVGVGQTIREANEQARQKGIENAFLVRVSSESEVLAGSSSL